MSVTAEKTLTLDILADRSQGLRGAELRLQSGAGVSSTWNASGFLMKLPCQRTLLPGPRFDQHMPGSGGTSL